MEESIAKRLGIKKFPFEIKNEKGNTLYHENQNGYFFERTYDENNNLLTYKNSKGESSEWTYNSNGNELTYKSSQGYWFETTYDERGNELTFKNSNGVFLDYRPKQVELTLDEIAKKFNVDVKQLKIKK